MENFCFQICNRLVEMMKSGDAGIFPLLLSLKKYTRKTTTRVSVILFPVRSSCWGIFISIICTVSSMWQLMSFFFLVSVVLFLVRSRCVFFLAIESFRTTEST